MRRQLSPSAGDSQASLASVAEDGESGDEEAAQGRTRTSHMSRQDTGQIVDEIMGHVIGSPPATSPKHR